MKNHEFEIENNKILALPKNITHLVLTQKGWYNTESNYYNLFLKTSEEVGCPEGLAGRLKREIPYIGAPIPEKDANVTNVRFELSSEIGGALEDLYKNLAKADEIVGNHIAKHVPNSH